MVAHMKNIKCGQCPYVALDAKELLYHRIASGHYSVNDPKEKTSL